MGKVLWIQDIDPSSRTGGAQITDMYMIEEFRRRGNEIVWESNPLTALKREDFDFAVISNAKNKQNWDAEVHEKFIEKGIRWVKFEHDHACKWRAYFPFADRCAGKDCPAKSMFGWQYTKAAGIVYLSSFQREAHDFWHGFEIRGAKVCITPPYVDYKKYMDAIDTVKRSVDQGVMLANLYRFKGFYANTDYAKAHPDETFHHYGPIEFSPDDISYIEKRNIVLHNPVSNGYMPSLLAGYSKLVHLSDNFLPCERSVLEGFFAGCTVIANENVGATRYSWWGDAEGTIHAMDATRETFCQFVEEVTK